MGEPNLATMPEEVSLRILQYVDDEYSHCDILALEGTCRAFRNLLQDDKIWELFSSCRGLEFHIPPTNRERAFIRMSHRAIMRHQKHSNNLVLEHLGEADGVRRLLSLLLDAMKLRGDSIDYLVEVVQCNVIYRLQKAMTLVVGTLRPGDSYPKMTAKDLRLLDHLFRTPGDGVGFLQCSVVNGIHVCTRFCSPGNVADDHTITYNWMWPAHDCKDNDFLGQDERQKLVRALAYRAGIVKMSGEVFSIISTEILHDMAVLISHAFDLCNEEIGDTIEESDAGIPLSVLYCSGRDNMDMIDAGVDDCANIFPPGESILVDTPSHNEDAAEEHRDTMKESEDDISNSMEYVPDQADINVPKTSLIDCAIIPHHETDAPEGLGDTMDESDSDISLFTLNCPSQDNMKMMEGGLNYCANYCPSGGNKFVIIPRHIKDAAELIGMRPILGFGSFGAEWAAEDEEFKNEEIEDAFDQYFENTTENSQ